MGEPSKVPQATPLSSGGEGSRKEEMSVDTVVGGHLSSSSNSSITGEPYHSGSKEAYDLGPKEDYHSGPKETYDLGPKEAYYSAPNDAYYSAPKKNYNSGPKEAYCLAPKEAYDSGPNEAYDSGQKETYYWAPNDLGPKGAYDSGCKEAYHSGPKEACNSAPKGTYSGQKEAYNLGLKDALDLGPKEAYYSDPKEATGSREAYYSRPKEARSGLGPAGPSDEEGPLAEERRHRRMLSNRESARRSRARKQERLDDLRAQLATLCSQNSQMAADYTLATQKYSQILTENQTLRNEARDLSHHLQHLYHTAAARHLDSSHWPSGKPAISPPSLK